MKFSEPLYVVNTRPGPGTGETIYTDNRGGEWITSQPGDFLSDGTAPTGVSRSVIVNGVILPMTSP